VNAPDRAPSPRLVPPSQGAGNDNAGEDSVTTTTTSAEVEGWALLPALPAANDELFDGAEELLSADPEFAAVCDARRDGWIEAMEQDAEFQCDPAGRCPRAGREGKRP